MNTLNNIVFSFKIRIDEFIKAAFNVVIDFSNQIEEYRWKAKLDDCIGRANNAYRSVAKANLPKPITAKQLGDILNSAPSFNIEELRIAISRYTNCNDSEYVLFLAISTMHVFKKNRIPKFIENNDVKYLN